MSRAAMLAHRVSVVLMAVGVLVATLDGFAQSYAGLYRWAIERGLNGWKAETFPLLVDLFVIVGELGLFALALEGHRLTRRGLSWLDMALPFGLASAGWAVSLAFNVGAVGNDWRDQVTAAVAPVASMLGLLVLLRTVHRLIVRGPVETAPGEVSATVDPTGDRPDVDTVRAVVEPGQLPALDAVEVEPSRDGDDAETGHDSGHLDETGHAGHAPVADMASAVRSARAAGRAVRSIADEFGITRYRVNKILDGDAEQVPATVNGHRPK